MMKFTRRINIFALALLATSGAWAQLSDIEMEQGKFEGNWQSLEQWDCPEWFKDAKFGLWAHWGPQCQANSGDWYARYMYQNQTSWDEEKQAYINCKEYGFKEYCRDWKADKWDPEAIIAKYAQVGCKYFMALGNHHDNFDCWNSPYQEWNSVNIGPQKDLCGGWAEAARRHGLKFGMSIHASHAWTWYEIGRKYGDVRLTKADGVGQWWEGYDPNELYAQAHENPSTGWDNIGNIHSQWAWNNGASIPDEAYKTKLQNRCRQMVNDYRPDMIYFDDTVLPFWGCDNQWGQDFLAYYYNHMSNLNGGGDPNVVVTGKILPDEQKECMMWDVERGIPDRPQEKYWQTCTCIGGWHYAYHDVGNYKSASTVIRMLIDIVSKNGNLLLSIPLKGDGTYDSQELAVLNGIEAWMKINGESIYGTRVWKNFGEGPLAESANALNAQGFNEGQNYSSEDVRFVHRNDTVYATNMAWPSAGAFTYASFGYASEYYSGQVAKVELLGAGEVEFTQGVGGLTIQIPATHPNDIAPAFRITFRENTQSDNDILQGLITGIDAWSNELSATSSYVNTGRYNTIKVNALLEVVAQAKTVDSTDAEAVSKAITAIRTAYQNLQKNGINEGGLLSSDITANLTSQVLVDGSNFSGTLSGTRYGTLDNWTSENYSIDKGSEGVRRGLDNYGGTRGISLGVWDDKSSNVGDLTNARIYRRVTLEPGVYYFGAAYNSLWGCNDKAYMFVSKEILTTDETPTKSMAYYQVNKAKEGSDLYGLFVKIDEAGDYYIGWQDNLDNGSAEQEFRAIKVAFYRVAGADKEGLSALTSQYSTTLSGYADLLKETNSGYYDPEKYAEMQQTLSEIDTDLPNMSDEEIQSWFYNIQELWSDYQAEAKNPEGAIDESIAYTDITTDILHEAKNFSRKDESVTTRFAQPLYWTVENFKIPNGSDGTKYGLDKYTGNEALMLGVWDDRDNNTSGNLASARIFQKIHLEPGKYYFGASYNAIYNLNAAYMFVSEQKLGTTYIPTKSMAYMNIMDCTTNGDTYGIYFLVPEAKDLYIGFQANLAGGNTEQEFRAETVTLLRYDVQTGFTPIPLQAEPTHTGIYTLDGRRLSAPQRGLNIIDGRKVIR